MKWEIIFDKFIPWIKFLRIIPLHWKIKKSCFTSENGSFRIFLYMQIYPKQRKQISVGSWPRSIEKIVSGNCLNSLDWGNQTYNIYNRSYPMYKAIGVITPFYNKAPGNPSCGSPSRPGMWFLAGCDRSAFSGTRDLLVSSTWGTVWPVIRWWYGSRLPSGGPIIQSPA